MLFAIESPKNCIYRLRTGCALMGTLGLLLVSAPVSDAAINLVPYVDNHFNFSGYGYNPYDYTDIYDAEGNYLESIPPTYVYSPPGTSIGTGGITPGRNPYLGNDPATVSNNFDPYGTFQYYTLPQYLDEKPLFTNYIAPYGGNGYGINAGKGMGLDPADEYLIFQPGGAAVLRVQMINTSNVPITSLYISYDAQNLSVANGQAFIGSDIVGFENVAINFFCPDIGHNSNTGFGGYMPELNFSDTAGVRKSVSATIDTYFNGNLEQPWWPGQEMNIYFWMDRSQFGGIQPNNAYLFDNLHIIAIPEPSPVLLTFLLATSLFYQRRRIRR
jgi:hypothetical protein